MLDECTYKMGTIWSCQVDAYEAKNQELMAENTDLRALLRSTQVIFLFFSFFEKRKTL